MTSEYALIVTVNYIQSNNLKKSSIMSVNKHNNNNTNIIHILYEASIFVIDWGANLKVVNKLFLPLYYCILYQIAICTRKLNKFLIVQLNNN